MSDEAQSDGRLLWDAAVTEEITDKVVLVGITYIAPDGETVESQSQYFGRVVSTSAKGGVEIACGGSALGELRLLPPDTIAYQPADPGEYRLRSTGDVVLNPDFLSTWTIYKPPKV